MVARPMKISARLAWAFGAVLTVSIVAAVLSLMRLAAIQENLRDIVLDNNVRIELSNNMSDDIHVVSRVMRSIVILEDQTAKNSEMLKITKAREDYDRAWEALQKMPAGETGKAIRAKIVAARGVTLRPVATNAATASHMARAATGSAAPWRRWASSE